jgi:hypothetical protein
VLPFVTQLRDKWTNLMQCPFGEVLEELADDIIAPERAQTAISLVARRQFGVGKELEGAAGLFGGTVTPPAGGTLWARAPSCPTTIIETNTAFKSTGPSPLSTTLFHRQMC